MRGECRKDQARLRRDVTPVVQKQHAAMRMSIAMHQGADVMVFGDENAPLRGSFGKQRRVAGIHRGLADIDDVVTGIPHGVHRLRCGVRVGEDAHAIQRRS